MLIVIIGFFLYLPTLSNGFVWDDEEIILSNPQVQSLDNIPAFFSGSTFASGGGISGLSGTYFRPMMLTSFAITNSFFAQKALGFHLVQIIFHLTNAVLTYLILFYIFKKFNLNEFWPLAISLIFLVHPINVEAVSYVSATQEVLFYFFAALAFLFVLKKESPKQIFWSTTMILFSLFSKETGSVFAATIFVYLFLFEKKKILPFTAGMVMVLVVYCFFRFGIAHVFFAEQGLATISNATFGERLLLIPKAVNYYLGNFIWPTNIAIDQQWLVKEINFSDFWGPLIFDLGFLGTLSFFGYLSYRKGLFKLWLFFFIWFIFALGFHLQLFPLDMTVADRWFYSATVGLMGMIVLPFKIKWVLVGIVITILSIFSFKRELDWHDGLTLYSRDIQKSQNVFDLENNLGVELYRVNRKDEAKIHFEKSAELLPKWWTSWNNLGVIYEDEGDFEKAEEYYRQSMKNASYYRAYQNYAKILYRQGKLAELKSFLENDGLIKLPYNGILRQLQYLLYNNPR